MLKKKCLRTELLNLPDIKVAIVNAAKEKSTSLYRNKGEDLACSKTSHVTNFVSLRKSQGRGQLGSTSGLKYINTLLAAELASFYLVQTRHTIYSKIPINEMLFLLVPFVFPTQFIENTLLWPLVEGFLTNDK